jgi:hypothetical protein
MGLLASLATMPRTIAWLACVLALALSAAPAPVAAQPASGADIKAAFLLNFAKFVEWPGGGGPPGRPFTIGVLGDDAMADALRDLGRGKSAAGRPLNTLRVTIKDPLADLHMLFVGASEERRLAAVLERVTGGSVLTVSDLNRFCELGGTIQFRSEHDRVRFDINLGQAERSGLVINSKLLALARSVLHASKPTGVSR